MLILPYLSVSSMRCSVGIFLIFFISFPCLFLVFSLSVVSDSAVGCVEVHLFFLARVRAIYLRCVCLCNRGLQSKQNNWNTEELLRNCGRTAVKHTFLYFMPKIFACFKKKLYLCAIFSVFVPISVEKWH